MKKAIGRWFIIVAVVFDVLAVVYISCLFLIPVKALTIQEPDKILNPGKQVVQGQVLIYQIAYCKYTKKQAAVTRTLVGAVNYSLPASTNNVPVGCKIAISRNTIIPDGVIPGTYYLSLCAAYQVNQLRVETVCHRSEQFQVLPKVTSAPTSSSVSPAVAADAQSVSSAPGLPLVASPGSPVLYTTDPVTQEPTQPPATRAPTQTVTRPSLVMQVIGSVKSLLGQ